MTGKKVRGATAFDEQKWEQDLKAAQNYKDLEGLQKTPNEHIERITVAEVLGIGHYMLMPPEVALVRDTNGKIWVIPETQSADRRGLVSRYDVRPGMELELRILEYAQYKTQAFVLSKKS